MKEFLNLCSCKLLNLGSRVLKYAKCNNHDQDWQTWSKLSQQKDRSIPKDVPRGHLAVYVGEDCKRYVIKVSLLSHPLFKALLDLTEEAFGFTTGSSKLYIPCSESIFISVLNYVKPHHKMFSCF